MAAELLTDASRALDANANPYAGAKWYFYATGTLTPQAVYTTAALSVEHTNPVVADAGGKFPPIYFDAAKQYRGVLENSSGTTTIYDIDPINSGVMAQLMQGGGAALVGFSDGGTDGVTRTIQDKGRENRTAADKGAAIDGSTDDSDALIALFADMATTGRVHLLSGTYKVTKPLTIPPGIIEGGNVVLDFSTADPADFPGTADGTCVTIQGGAMTQIADIDTDLAIGDRIFSFASAHGLSAGQSFNLSGTVDYAGNSFRSYYRKGEMFRVAYVVDSTTVAVEGACRDTYAAADTEVWVRSGDSFTQGCASLTILGPDTIGTMLRVNDLDLSNVSRVRAEGGKWNAISLRNCFGVVGDNLKARQNVSGTGNYGIVVENSQEIRLKGNAYGYFNGIAVGGALTTGGLVGMNRDVHFEGIAASHPSGGLAGANLHGNSEYCSYRGVFFNGVVMAGNKCEAHGDFIGKSGASPISFAEMHGHDFVVTGTARTMGSDLPTTTGAINMGGAATTYGSGARYGGRTTIDLQYYCPQATRIVTWRPTDLARTDVVLDLRLDIMDAHPSSRFMILSKNGATGNDFPRVELNRFNCFDNDVAITWSLNSGTAIANWRQEKTVSVSGSSAATYTSAMTFDVPFPRTPRFLATINGPSIAGSSPLTATVKSLSASGGTVEVSTTDKANQTVSTSVVVTAVSQ